MKQCIARLYSIYFNSSRLCNSTTISHISYQTTSIRRFSQHLTLHQEIIRGKSPPTPKDSNQSKSLNTNQHQSTTDSGKVKDTPHLQIIHNELNDKIKPGDAKIIPEGSSQDEFLTTIFDNLEPYLDTYKVYSRLKEAGFTDEQSDQIIHLLIYQLNSKLSKLSTIYAQKYELESEQYLFESAQQEIRVDITRSREQHVNELITLVNILERDFNIITDELNNDYLKLKNDSKVAIEEQKSDNTLNVKKLYLRIQETNHKITTELDSHIRSEIESLRWYLSRWGLITLFASLFVTSLIFFSKRFRMEKDEAKKEFVPLVIREPSEYDEDDYHTDLDKDEV
ncbi:uncharacterized protein KGF55_001916 [Candida pseudojiufengensis]|uniref:uncharacterized protein n=1 Tax=Candida pseudojiufengensis TaxID=497109 RepID=UPI002224EF94|nr:uncharacterized protein KGF55_001916 [Candida pseudojiufengensis]KAI5964846.1 hypothetical protein KGF55_001916 [Candida pseudojiufengensis]